MSVAAPEWKRTRPSVCGCWCPHFQHGVSVCFYVFSDELGYRISVEDSALTVASRMEGAVSARDPGYSGYSEAAPRSSVVIHLCVIDPHRVS